MKSLYLKILGGVALSALLVSCPTHELNPPELEQDVWQETQYSSVQPSIPMRQSSFYSVHDIDLDGKADLIMDSDGDVLFYDPGLAGRLQSAWPMSQNVQDAASKYLTSQKDSSAMKKADDDLFFEMYMQAYSAVSAAAKSVPDSGKPARQRSVQ